MYDNLHQHMSNIFLASSKLTKSKLSPISSMFLSPWTPTCWVGGGAHCPTSPPINVLVHTLKYDP